MTTETRALFTVRQFAQKHPAFTEPSLRNLIFLAKERESTSGKIPGNGLAPAIVRIGKKVLLDEDAFFSWLNEQNKRGAVA